MRIPIPEIQRQAAPTDGPRPAMIQPGSQQGTQALASSLAQVATERERQAALQLDNFERIENEQRKARNVERVAAARLQWAETFQNRQTDAGPAADGFTGSLLKDFKGWAETSAAAIADEREREMFKGMIAPLGDHLGQSGIQFEGQQRRAWRRSTLADGIDTDALCPDPGVCFRHPLPDGERQWTRDDEVITFVARNLEPYRGFHVFMRALPGILAARPAARVVIVGGGISAIQLLNEISLVTTTTWVTRLSATLARTNCRYRCRATAGSITMCRRSAWSRSWSAAIPASTA